MTTAIEALVLWSPGSTARLEEVERAIAAVGGQIVAGFWPHALLIQVAEGVVGNLQQALGAVTIYTEAVPAATVAGAAEPMQSVLTLWNQRRSPPGVQSEPRGRDLPWDAPGYLPPDPPPEIRKRLGRKQGDDGDAHQDS